MIRIAAIPGGGWIGVRISGPGGTVHAIHRMEAVSMG